MLNRVILKSMFVTVICALVFFSCIKSHSNMHYPTPRGNKQFSGYCSRGQGCNTACESPASSSPFNSQYAQKKVVKRGEKISVKWYRQNHPGGFVRLAIVPMNNSDEESSFDNSIVKYVCYETNCKEQKEDSFLGKLNGGGSPLCSTELTIPGNLKDGPITLQWTWFGGGVYFAQQNTSFANYVNCADMELKGGNIENEKPSPVFQGGDVANPNSNQCRYWSTNEAGQCPAGSEQNEKCGAGPSKNGTPQGI